MVLVPKNLLFLEISKRIKRTPKNESVELLIPAIVDLPEIFKVSDAVILRRLQKEGVINNDGV